MTEPAAPEHSAKDHPSPACHCRAKRSVTAWAWATLSAAARSPRIHAAYSVRAKPSGDAAAAVVVGRDATVVVGATVVVDEDEVDELTVVVGAVVV